VTSRGRWRSIALIAAGLAAIAAVPDVAASDLEAVDIGLVLAVDVSGSVSGERYSLQMNGIAAAFEDPAVQGAILGGRHRALAITLVQWSEKAQISIPWMVVATEADARAFAERVRHVPRISDQFTCMSQMMRFVADKVLPRIPAQPARLVIDVSGDGAENCNPPIPVDALRDELVADAITINGLPILEGDDGDRLEPWYASHLVGGTGAFLMPARGFADFARAMRQKFLIEISSTGQGEAGGKEAVVKSLKERLSDKASDEQRVDNCRVPLDRRGTKPRPDCPPPPQMSKSSDEPAAR
jgi:hypothetical protein